MYPRTLLDEEVESDGEKQVFAVLRDGLSDEWEAYHSASWMLRDPAEGALDGEIDFVLCHPEEAILCLEVKGGGIECRHGEWFRLVDGKRERAKDPFSDNGSSRDRLAGGGCYRCPGGWCHLDYYRAPLASDHPAHPVARAPFPGASRAKREPLIPSFRRSEAPSARVDDPSGHRGKPHGTSTPSCGRSASGRD
jgi:hypothetical protein